MITREIARTTLAAERRRRSFVLCYHGVGESSIGSDPRFLRVAPRILRAEIELLRDAGYEFVTVSELAASGPVRGTEPAPGLVALSFDDGWSDNHTTLLPLLGEYRIPATIYVTTGLMGQPNPWVAPASGMRMLTADEVVACARAGMEIGAHTLTHPDLSSIRAEGCRREVMRSRAILRELTDAPVASFAYPFFRYGSDAVAAVHDAGFDSAVSGSGSGDWSRLTMQRAAIGGKDRLASFTLKLLGRYDALLGAAPMRLALGATRSLRRHRWELIDRHG